MSCSKKFGSRSRQIINRSFAWLGASLINVPATSPSETLSLKPPKQQPGLSKLAMPIDDSRKPDLLSLTFVQRTGSIKSHALLGGLHHRYVLLLRLQRPARYRISADLNCRAASRWLWPLCCATARRSSLSRPSSNIVCDVISCPPPRNSGAFEGPTRSCRFVTHDGNARSFPLCSLENMIMAAAEAYAGFALGTTANALLGSRHASLYPPSRRRTTLHNLPKLCGPRDVRPGRRTGLEQGEDSLHL
jgi:hypothetical protein